MSSCSRRMEIVTSTVIKLIETNIKESGEGGCNPDQPIQKEVNKGKSDRKGVSDIDNESVGIITSKARLRKTRKSTKYKCNATISDAIVEDNTHHTSATTGDLSTVNNNVTKTFSVNKSKVHFILGKNGKILDSIRRETGAYIHVEGKSKSDARLVEITGADESVRKSFDTINKSTTPLDLAEDEKVASIKVMEGPMLQTVIKQDNILKRDEVLRLVSPRGFLLEMVRSATDTVVGVNVHKNLLEILGNQQSVNEAFDAIQKIIAPVKNSSKTMAVTKEIMVFGDRKLIKKAIAVSKEDAARSIGYKGNIITAVELEFSTRLIYDRSMNPMKDDDVLEVIGEEVNVEKTLDVIKKIVDPELSLLSEGKPLLLVGDEKSPKKIVMKALNIPKKCLTDLKIQGRIGASTGVSIKVCEHLGSSSEIAVAVLIGCEEQSQKAIEMLKLYFD